MRLPLACLVLTTACSGSGPKDPAYTPAGKRPCEQMATHLVGVMAGEPSDAADRLTHVLVERCTEDHWTLDAERCFEKLAAFDELDRCVPLLTVDQREHFAAAIDAVFPKP